MDTRTRPLTVPIHHDAVTWVDELVFDLTLSNEIDRLRKEGSELQFIFHSPRPITPERLEEWQRIRKEILACHGDMKKYSGCF
jgi:hypothetical protein